MRSASPSLPIGSERCGATSHDSKGSARRRGVDLASILRHPQHSRERQARCRRSAAASGCPRQRSPPRSCSSSRRFRRSAPRSTRTASRPRFSTTSPSSSTGRPRRFAEATSPFVVCAYADVSVSQEARGAFSQGEQVRGRPDHRSAASSVEDPRGCHLLYFSKDASGQVKRDPAGLRQAPVLSVGEGRRFLEQGGLIAFVLENERVRFAISKRRADAAGWRSARSCCGWRARSTGR